MKVYLRAFEFDDYSVLHRWRLDEEIRSQTSGPKRFISTEQTKKWLEQKIFNDGTEVYLAICSIETDEMVGYLSIINIDLRNKSAEWGGIVVGSKEHRRKGCAKQAALQLMDYAFGELGLHRFSGLWLEGHGASIAMAEKLGFKREGVLRDSAYKNHSFQNLVVMSVLEEEFRELKEILRKDIFT